MHVDTEAYIALGFLGGVIAVTLILFGYIIRQQRRRK